MTYKNNLLFRSGDLFLTGKTKEFLDYYHIGNDDSLFYINNWSIVHFLTGILIGGILKMFKKSNYEIIIQSLILHTIWEIWQVFIKNTNIDTLRGKIDIIVDTILFMSGVFVIK
jgi:hypothetical protein